MSGGIGFRFPISAESMHNQKLREKRDAMNSKRKTMNYSHWRAFVGGIVFTELMRVFFGLAEASPPSFRVKSDFRDPTVIKCIGGKRYLCRPELKFGTEQTCGY